MPYIVNMRVVAQYRKDIYIVRAQIERTHNIVCRVMPADEAGVREIEKAGYGELEKIGGGWESLPKYWVAYIYAVTSREHEAMEVVSDMIDDERVLGSAVPYCIEEKWCEDKKILTETSELERELAKRGLAFVGGKLTRQVSAQDMTYMIEKKIRRARMNYITPGTRREVDQMFQREEKRKK